MIAGRSSGVYAAPDAIIARRPPTHSRGTPSAGRMWRRSPWPQQNTSSTRSFARVVGKNALEMRAAQHVVGHTTYVQGPRAPVQDRRGQGGRDHGRPGEGRVGDGPHDNNDEAGEASESEPVPLAPPKPRTRNDSAPGSGTGRGSISDHRGRLPPNFGHEGVRGLRG